jgi:hypothetical protein
MAFETLMCPHVEVHVASSPIPKQHAERLSPAFTEWYFRLTMSVICKGPQFVENKDRA